MLIKNSKDLSNHKHLHNDVCVSLRHNTLSPSILAQTCPSGSRDPRSRDRWGKTLPFPLLTSLSCQWESIFTKKYKFCQNDPPYNPKLTNNPYLNALHKHSVDSFHKFLTFCQNQGDATRLISGVYFEKSGLFDKMIQLVVLN